MKATARRPARKAHKTAADIMTSPLITLGPDATLEEAAITLSEHAISGAPVVDFNGAPLGVVSLFDIVSHFAGLKQGDDEPGGFYRYSFPRFREGGDAWEQGWEEVEIDEARRKSVTEVMTSEIISVPEDAPLSVIVKTLYERKIHRLFVMRKGHLVGVISTMDVLEVV